MLAWQLARQSLLSRGGWMSARSGRGRHKAVSFDGALFGFWKAVARREQTVRHFALWRCRLALGRCNDVSYFRETSLDSRVSARSARLSARHLVSRY